MKKIENKSEAFKELLKSYSVHEQCPVTITLKAIGGKWKPFILYLICYDVNRFGELRKWIKGVSKKILAQKLKELEEDGLIYKVAFALLFILLFNC